VKTNLVLKGIHSKINNCEVFKIIKYPIMFLEYLSIQELKKKYKTKEEIHLHKV
jgi:hypothetical protein